MRIYHQVGVQDFDKGLAAYQNGDFATALHAWKLLAERGDTSAQRNLDLMYAFGREVAQDYVYAKLKNLLRRAAIKISGFCRNFYILINTNHNPYPAIAFAHFCDRSVRNRCALPHAPRPSRKALIHQR